MKIEIKKLDRLPLNMEHDNCLPSYRLDNCNNDVKTEEVKIEPDEGKYALPFSHVDSIEKEEFQIKSDEEGDYSLPVFKLHDFDDPTNVQNLQSNNWGQSGTFDEGIDLKENMWEVVENVENFSVTQEEKSVNGVSIATIPEKISKACPLISTHRDHKCEICNYQPERREHSKSYTLIYKKRSEIEMFKCGICSYETKHKSCLKGHMLIHKEPSEIKMFKCEICSYETKHKSCLKNHMLKHKNPSEIEMFKCEICSYETKQKHSLKNHMLIHKKPGMEMFKCEICNFETKHKYYLKTHMLIHKETSEIEMFKCEICNFETNRKYNLKIHMLIHKKPSEIEMFKCEMCTFETKRKDCFRNHVLLIHKKPSEIVMLKCEFCTFETKRKVGLKVHMLKHKNHQRLTCLNEKFVPLKR